MCFIPLTGVKVHKRLAVARLDVKDGLNRIRVHTKLAR
jgi:hypothetical protein